MPLRTGARVAGEENMVVNETAKGVQLGNGKRRCVGSGGATTPGAVPGLTPPPNPLQGSGRYQLQLYSRSAWRSQRQRAGGPRGGRSGPRSRACGAPTGRGPPRLRSGATLGLSGPRLRGHQGLQALIARLHIVTVRAAQHRGPPAHLLRTSRPPLSSESSITRPFSQQEAPYPRA